MPLFQKLLIISFGFFYAVILGQYLISKLIFRSWDGLLLEASVDKIEDKQLSKWSRWTNSPLGWVEKALFFSAIIVDVPEFIVFWLAMKVAARWGAWEHRGVFNTFLIGTGLSLGWGVLGGKFVSWSLNKEYLKAISWTSSLLLFTLFLWFYIHRAVVTLEKNH